jgi:hypothetical protein
VSQTKRPQSKLCMNFSFLGVPHSIQAYDIFSYDLCSVSFVHPMAGVQKVSRDWGATSEVWVPEGWLSVCEMIYTFLCVRKKL